MNWQVTPVALVYAATAIISLVAAGIAASFHPTRGARFLALTALSGSIWAIAYLLGVFNTDLIWKKHMIRIEYVGIVGTAYFFFLFAMSYTSFERWLNRTTVTLFAIIPTLGLLMALTHDLHPLLYQSFGLTTYNGLVITQKTYGIGFWILMAHSYLLILGGALMLVSDVIRHPQMFKGQTYLLVIGAIMPLVMNVGYLAGLNPVRPYDLTPVAFILSSALLLIGMSRFKLLNLVPIGHDLVFRNVGSGVLILSADGHVLEMNPTAERILGRTQAEVAGKLNTEVFPEHRKLIDQYRDVNEAHAQITIPATKRTYDMQIAPLYHRSRVQEVIGRVVLLTDITEREQMIAELDAFAHSVAHDLKTPISAMMGYAELLRNDLDTTMTDRTDFITRSIIRAASNMDSIINSLLLLAQLRRADEIRLGAVDMAAVVSSVLSRFEQHIHEAKAEIIKPDQWPDGLISYMPWIEEIWANYLSNAIKYGGKPPRIELGATLLPDNQVRFWVRDNGKGLTEEQRNKLFSEGTRLEDHAGTEGHGLGLSIVQRIAARLGGDVGIESTPGEGSTFYFVLPLQPTTTTETVQPAPLEAVTTQGAA